MKFMTHPLSCIFILTLTLVLYMGCDEGKHPFDSAEIEDEASTELFPLARIRTQERVKRTL